MPITRTGWATLVVTAMLIVGSLVPEAWADSLPQTQYQLVSSLDQLEGDREVKKNKYMYPPLSAANYLYSVCGKELDVSDSEQAYLTQKFTDVTRAYMQAYQDAYVRTTNSAPPQSFVNDVAKTLTQRQQTAVDNVALLMKQRGCKDNRLRPIMKYVTDLQKQDRDRMNYKPQAPALPYQ